MILGLVFSFFLASELVPLMGLERQMIWVNPAEVVTVRAPRGDTSLHPGVKCILHMADGKTVSVIEDCAEVRKKLTGRMD